MSHLPTHDHDANPRRPRARVDASAAVALEAASGNDNASAALLLEQLLLDDGVLSLPPMIAGELLHLYEYHARCRATDAPNTTWELPASGLQDLQPTTAFRRS